MHKFLNATHRSVVWFKKTFDADDLIVKPPFQRNPVWSLRQKSSLIDTILLEYPIPELYMQEITTPDGEQKHVLIDGQQRIRAILSFLAGEFELEDESPKWAGLAFDDLNAEDRKKIFEYNFVIRLLPELPDEHIRAIFQRLNRNTTVLTAQELRHATYWGPFIKLMEEISEFEFWDNAAVFSANDRRRMYDIEYISELAVAYVNGLQNKKKRLEEFYQQYETSFDAAGPVRDVFVRVLGELQQLLPDLPKTRWRKKSDFYTLFLFLAKRTGSLPFSAAVRLALGERLRLFGAAVDDLLAAEQSALPPDPQVAKYVANVERAASDLARRQERDVALETALAPILTG